MNEVRELADILEPMYRERAEKRRYKTALYTLLFSLAVLSYRRRKSNILIMALRMSRKAMGVDEFERIVKSARAGSMQLKIPGV